MNRLIIILCILTNFSAFSQKLLNHLVLNTNKGPVVIEMDDAGTPLHFNAITKLVEMGIYTGSSFNYAQDGLYVQMGEEEFREYGFFEEQRKLIKALPNEITELEHHRAVVTMPNFPDDKLRGGQYLFTVMLDRFEDLDKKQTIVGFVIHGIEIFDEVSKGPKTSDVLNSPLKVETAVFMTKENAIAYYTKFQKEQFKSDIFDFSKYSFLLIIIIQLIVFYGKNKIESQLLGSMQLIVFLIASFSVMAQFYPLVADSTLASIGLVSFMLFCFKIMSSLESSRGLSK